MIHHRASYGSALHWLEGRRMLIQRYLQTFYSPYDWSVIKNFFWNNPIQARVILDDFSKTNEAKLNIVIDIFLKGKSLIIYIVGGRGSGKTATAFMLVEVIHRNNPSRRIYYIGDGVNKQVLPSWCYFEQDIRKAPDGCVAILDESGIQFNAREYQDKDNIDMSKLLMIARHKDMSLIFLTQHTSLSDTNIQRLRDLVIWKMSNDYTPAEKGTTRSKEHQFWKKVRQMMMPRTKEECLFEYPMQRRFIHFSHQLPDCWTEQLSKTWKGRVFEKKIEVKKANRKEVKKDVY